MQRLVQGYAAATGFKRLCSQSLMPMTGLEPVRYRYQRIFLLLYVTIAALLRCSLDYVFTICVILHTQVDGIQSLHIYNDKIIINLARHCLLKDIHRISHHSHREFPQRVLLQQIYSYFDLSNLKYKNDNLDIVIVNSLKNYRF